MRRRENSQLPQITLFLKVFPHLTGLIAGAMIIPTLWHSLHDETVYPDPYKYNPYRWGPDGIAEEHPKLFPYKAELIVGIGLFSVQVLTSVSVRITLLCIS